MFLVNYMLSLGLMCVAMMASCILGARCVPVEVSRVAEAQRRRVRSGVRSVIR